MTTDTTAIGYVNGILYLGHDDNNTTQVERYNKSMSNNNGNTNINNNHISNNTFANEARQKADGVRSIVAAAAYVDDEHNASAYKQLDHGDVAADSVNDVLVLANGIAANTNTTTTATTTTATVSATAIATAAAAAAAIDVSAAADDASDDSLASMETLSDNVSIWIDGEKHWISGVDATTTCADLILALLHYQDNEQQQQLSAAVTTASNNKTHVTPATGTATAAVAAAGVTNAKHANAHQSLRYTQPHTNAKDDEWKFASKNIEELLSEYVIVKQHRHCEEYLDGSTKVFDVLPARDMPDRKECELLLRRLVIAAPHMNTQVASLLSTDKDSGMGSPVGSSRSAKFRRKKYKATTATAAHWLAQSNTLHPKLSQKSNSANERLLKIILAQDETIHRQLTLLREKERQILKIEEEKHRVRERELGKNYLLETYLNGLDEADIEKDYEDGVEIFIDEPYEMLPLTTTVTTTTHAIKTTAADQRRERKQLHRHATVAATTTTANINLKATQPQNAPDAAAVNEMARQTMATATAIVNNNNNTSNNNNSSSNSTNENEIELKKQNEQQQQIVWLEKVYEMNKRLQREEEQLLKLHAKIRKHQVKRAYQTKHEVIEQIDKLDNELAVQCDNIRQIEDNLHASNEQLKQKLSILEKLSQELFDETNQVQALSALTEQTDCITATASATKMPTVDTMSAASETTHAIGTTRAMANAGHPNEAAAVVNRRLQSVGAMTLASSNGQQQQQGQLQFVCGTVRPQQAAPAPVPRTELANELVLPQLPIVEPTASANAKSQPAQADEAPMTAPSDGRQTGEHVELRHYEMELAMGQPLSTIVYPKGTTAMTILATQQQQQQLLAQPQLIDKNLLPLQIDKIGNKEMFRPHMPVQQPTVAAATTTTLIHEQHFNEYVYGHLPTASPMTNTNATTTAAAAAAAAVAVALAQRPLATAKLEHNVDITCLGTLV